MQEEILTQIDDVLAEVGDKLQKHGKNHSSFKKKVEEDFKVVKKDIVSLQAGFTGLETWKKGQEETSDSKMESKLEPLREQISKFPQIKFDPKNQPYYQVSASGGGSSLPSQTGNSGKYLYTDGTNSSWLAAPGGTTLNVVSKVANYTALITDDVINCNTAGGAFNITLPNPALATKPLRIKITSTSVNTVTLLPSAAETIEGVALYALQNPTLRGAVVAISDGTNWWVY